MNNATPNIWVCSPSDDVPKQDLKLSVSSLAPVLNPVGWKDLWKLSPLSTVEGGVLVPGLPGVRSMTMENAWQFLKIWPGESGWQQDEAMEAFRSTCAIRYPRGRSARACGHHRGEDGSILGYIEARKRIYVPAYADLLRLPDRAQMIRRLQEVSLRTRVVIHDPDSYDVLRCGMSDLPEAIEYQPRPFAHAFLVALAVRDRLDLVLKPD